METSKKPTLYVSDLDGTLLGPDSRVSAESRNLLNQAVESGALFTIATARTPATVEGLMEGIIPSSLRAESTGHTPEINEEKGIREVPAIVMTGSALWLRGQRRFQSVEFIPEDAALEAFKVMEGRGLRPFTYCVSPEGRLNVYHSTLMSRREDAFYQERRRLPLKRFHLGQLPSRWDRVALFFATGRKPDTERACQALREGTPLAASWYPDIFQADTGLMDIYAPGVSKAKALRELARSVGAERTVVFGDNLNDLPMMREATLSVAVENALPEVRREANLVIGPNTSPSVAQFILGDFNKG